MKERKATTPVRTVARRAWFNTSLYIAKGWVNQEDNVRERRISTLACLLCNPAVRKHRISTDADVLCQMRHTKNLYDEMLAPSKSPLVISSLQVNHPRNEELVADCQLGLGIMLF